MSKQQLIISWNKYAVQNGLEVREPQTGDLGLICRPRQVTIVTPEGAVCVDSNAEAVIGGINLYLTSRVASGNPA